MGHRDAAGVKQVERAQLFHRLHAQERALVLPNAWDAASARIVEAAGAAAIATSSAAMAWALGQPDGERINPADLLAVCGRICRAVPLPVSVDIERGFGSSASEVAEIAGALLALGVIGVNIEDGTAPPEELGDRIRAIRAAAQRQAVPFFINARTDTYLVAASDPEARFEETRRRALLYVEAGADGVFIPGLDRIDEIRRMAHGIPRPLNIYAGYAGVPSVPELQAAGVRRVSLGCGPMQALLARMRAIAREAIGAGTYSEMTAQSLPVAEANGLFAPA